MLNNAKIKNKIFIKIKANFKLNYPKILSIINPIRLSSHEFNILIKFNFIKLHFEIFSLKKMNYGAIIVKIIIT